MTPARGGSGLHCWSGASRASGVLDDLLGEALAPRVDLGCSRHVGDPLGGGRVPRGGQVVRQAPAVSRPSSVEISGAGPDPVNDAGGVKSPRAWW
jgi:hypothetical protein